MHLLIKGKNVHVSERVRAYAEKRLAKLSRQLDDKAARLELEVTREKNPTVEGSHIAELTLRGTARTLRASEASPDLFSAIDLVADKLARQISRKRERRIKTAQAGNAERLTSIFDQFQEEAMDLSNDIQTSKQFLHEPMTAEEAVRQMDLLGHDFFLFVSSDTDETCVLYRRSNGSYAVIEATRAA